MNKTKIRIKEAMGIKMKPSEKLFQAGVGRPRPNKRKRKKFEPTNMALFILALWLLAAISFLFTK